MMGSLGGHALLHQPSRLARIGSLALLGAFLLTSLAPASLAETSTTNPVRIDAMSVAVTIDHHYALTSIRESLTNPSTEPREFTATVASPELSFITRFALEVDGQVYESTLEDSTTARADYDATVAASQTAALIESRDTHTYQVSLNIPASTTVVVDLSYEEMIYRAHGVYTYRFPLMASSGSKTIGLLSIEGTVTGSAAILSPSVNMGGLDATSPVDLTFRHHSSHLVQTADFVLTWNEASPTGAGTFITHSGPDGGTFVHVFSADGAGLSATPLPKDIVFVIDVSGSMSSSLPQVKTVFASIIADLKPADRFSVVTFSSSYWQWSDTLLDANTDNIKSAVDWVNDLTAQSGTDIDLGLWTGIYQLKPDAARAPTLILLSDGEATSGETNAATIRSNLVDRNTAGASVHTLAFGPHADFALMEALAHDNEGEVRRIWADQDAAAQIRGFYDSISTPLLRDVNLQYTEGASSAGPLHFARAYAGSDLIAVGQLAPGATEVAVTITGQGPDGPITISGTFQVETTEAGAFVERAWAFERIRELNAAASFGDALAKTEIVRLALEYQFVTDYTSLVVVLPPRLDGTSSTTPLPVRMTNSAVLQPSAPAGTGAYASTPPPKSVPAPGALLVALGLGGTALLAGKRRTARAR